MTADDTNKLAALVDRYRSAKITAENADRTANWTAEEHRRAKEESRKAWDTAGRLLDEIQKCIRGD